MSSFALIFCHVGVRIGYSITFFSQTDCKMHRGSALLILLLSWANVHESRSGENIIQSKGKRCAFVNLPLNPFRKNSNHNSRGRLAASAKLDSTGPPPPSSAPTSTMVTIAASKLNPTGNGSATATATLITSSSTPMTTTVSRNVALSHNRTQQTLATAANVTYLLNNLLHKYDNSLRPDIGGEPDGPLSFTFDESRRSSRASFFFLGF